MAMSSSDATQVPAEKRLEGIGGWLILLAVAQVLGPVQVAVSMFQEYASLPPDWFARYPLAFSVELLLRISYLGLLIYAAYLFFNRRTAFPNTYIAAIAAGLVLPYVVALWATVTTGINTFGALSSWDFLGYYIVGLVVGLLWMSYLLNSVRVRNTFVH
jgi:hypothetical protein